MKKLITFLFALFVLCGIASAQPATPAAPDLFIKGSMNIQYNTLLDGNKGKKGIHDDYDLSVNVSNSVIFHGKVFDTPQIIEPNWSHTSTSVTQARSLRYNLDCDVVNPKNPAQTRNIGRMYGVVPISSNGVYNYGGPMGGVDNLVIDILPLGSAAGFTSKFSGTAAGKPLVKPSNWYDNLNAVNITRLINGKRTTITLKKYDKMDFSNVVLAQGPVQIYQPVTVNGDLFYDYDKSCWFFNDFKAQYTENGIVKSDSITGTMRWVEDPQRKTNGLGHYDFDIRVNEPQVDTSAAFAGPSDESAFFTSDAALPGLTGTMDYKDTINGDGDTTASSVTIDLHGNNINKAQVMVLAKVIIFAAIIPMNSD